MAWVGTKVGVLGNHWRGGGRERVFVRLLETQMWFLPASSAGGRLSQETMAFANISVWDKSNPPTLASKPDNSVLGGCPWHLLSCCLSIGSQNDSV